MQKIKYPILFALMLFALIVCFAACKKDKLSCPDSVSLNSLFSFPVGTAINYFPLDYDSAYKELIPKHFDRVTPENVLKFMFVHPAPDRYEWFVDDYLSYIRSNNLQMHGHTLIWHHQTPFWLEEFKGTTQQWDSLMKNHIQTVMLHYQNDIQSWDVVNEAFNDDGTFRKSIWYDKLGPSYIKKAFEYAHETLPNATLFYNDYDLCTNPIKLQAVLKYFDALNQEEQLVDGIGMQMHIAINYPEIQDIQKAMEQIVDHGYQLHISELDVSINPSAEKDFEVTDLLLDRQAERYSQIYSLYNKLPPSLQFGITTWGAADKYSWKYPEYPLLFDRNLNPKPALCALLNLEN